MRNDLAFIPDNISAISYPSIHPQATPNHDIPQFQTDSTDNLIQQILKQRTQRLQRQQQKSQTSSLDQANKKLLFDIKGSNQIHNNILTQVKMKEQMKSSVQKLQRKSQHEMIPQLNQSLAERQQGSDGKKSIRNSIESIKQEKIQKQGENEPVSQHQISLQNRLKHLKYQIQQEMINREQIREINNQTPFSKKNIAELYQQTKFHQQKIDSPERNNNQSLENLQQSSQKALKHSASRTPSQKKVSSYSQYSMYMNNFIQQQENEQNSKSKSSIGEKQNSHPPIKSLPYSYQNQSKSSHGLGNDHGNGHGLKMEVNQFVYEGRRSGIQFDTPVNFLDREREKYDFAIETFMSQPKLAEDSTKKYKNQQKSSPINKVESSKKLKPYLLTKKVQFKQSQLYQKQNNQALQQIDTDYSQLNRQVKINDHRYQSNISLLYHQTNQLLNRYEFMIMDQEIKQIKKQIMSLQIHNHRAKISLRNASYSKRYNFISPIHKNNDKPIEYKSKFKIQKNLLDRLQQLKNLIKQEQVIFQEQQSKLTLLTKYYNLMKTKKIPNLTQNVGEYEYNSKLGKYCGNSIKNHNSQISIDSPYSTQNQFDMSPVNSFHGTNNFQQSPIGKKLTSPKRSPPKKKAQICITEPYQQYNLLKYKSQINKQMLLQYEVYNLGRLKRIQDQNRMIKKELQFVDEHIEHFDRSFAEELKLYEEKAKPKITYESFKAIQPETPFTRSPMSRDYHGNDKGSNNINIYRPDSINHSPLKSKSSFNKSLSQSKYSIKRQLSPKLTSNKALTNSEQCILDYSDKKSDTLVSFFKKKVDPTEGKDQYFLNAGDKQKARKKQTKQPNHDSSKKKLMISRSERSLSPRSKNILRFNTSKQLNDKNSIKSLRPKANDIKNKIQSGNKIIDSEYYLSSDGVHSNK